jgi:probable HAF family extracellular repeat protein
MQTTNAIKQRSHKKLIVVFGLVTLVFGCRAVAQVENRHSTYETRYRVVDLGTLGGTFSAGWGINDGPWISGISSIFGDLQSRAFLWRRGVMTDLGTLGGPNSWSYFPLNERGTVTGGAETLTPDALGEDFCGFGTYLTCLPVLWQHGSIVRLPILGGGNGAAFGLNNRGEVAGDAETNAADPTCVSPQVLQYKPVIWDRHGVHELPTFSGDPDGAALAINDRGEAVGWSGTCAPGYGPHETFLHALLWKDGTMTDLGNLGGKTNIVASDVNNRGQVIGYSNTANDLTHHAFVWRAGVMTDLGTLAGDSSSEPSDINELGQVVGASLDSGGNPRAFFWQRETITDLNELIPADSSFFLLYGGSINSRSEITGLALLKETTEVHAFLATPCGRDRFEDRDCEYQKRETSTAPSQTSPRLTIAVPEDVRKLLKRRLHFAGSNSTSKRWR